MREYLKKKTMGAFDCLNNGKIVSTSSTEVFSIHLPSNSTLNVERNDVESQKKDGCKRRKWAWWLLLDIPIIILVLTLLGIYELGVIPSHKSGFFCNDPKLSFPFNGDTISMGVLVAGTLLLPPLMIFVTEFVFTHTLRNDEQRNVKISSSCAVSGKTTALITRDYYYGYFFNLLIVELLKGFTGMPRPAFFELCAPDAAKNCTGSEFVHTFTCTSTVYSQWTQDDSYHSFPSGHTSLSVYAGLFLVWYLQVRAFKWTNRSALFIPLIQLLLVTFAIICSVSRITDHRHHWWDVAVGVIIGVVTLYFSVIVTSRRFACIPAVAMKNNLLNGIDHPTNRRLLVTKEAES